MSQIYVAHELVLRKKFSKYAYAHDFLGCHMNHYYYVKEELILISGSEITGYKYLNSNKLCKVINADLLKNEKTQFSLVMCAFCNKQAPTDGTDCTLTADSTEEIIGITGIQRLEEYTNVNDIRIAIELLKEYNQEVKGKYLSLDEYTKKENKRRMRTK